MREIKFRAYIARINTMIYNIDVYGWDAIGIAYNKLPEIVFDIYHIDWDDNAIVENGTYKEVLSILTGQDYIWIETGYELMQYTGLKDKNGIEIYEGDIVKDRYRNIKTIDWKGSAFTFNKGEDYLPNDLLDYEIIGNIHQNPELLQ